MNTLTFKLMPQNWSHFITNKGLLSTCKYIKTEHYQASFELTSPSLEYSLQLFLALDYSYE